jgi:hypothetical protein
MKVSSRQIAKMLEEVQALAARVHDKFHGPPGIACVRAFLKGDPDPCTHLGPPTPPAPGHPVSIRWSLFGRPDDNPDDDEQS